MQRDRLVVAYGEQVVVIRAEHEGVARPKLYFLAASGREEVEGRRISLRVDEAGDLPAGRASLQWTRVVSRVTSD